MPQPQLFTPAHQRMEMVTNGRSCTALVAMDGRIHSQNVPMTKSPLVPQDFTLPAYFALMVCKLANIWQLKHYYYLHAPVEKHNSDCEDGEVRLVGGASDSEGTVEVCVDKLWGLVGETGWSLTDAQVVCRQLGFPIDGNEVKIFMNYKQCNFPE